MFVRKRVIQTKQRRQRSRRCCGISVKNGLQFLSSMILPLMLGVFTVVITVQQQNMGRDQRIEDMNLARQQRLEDKSESRLQREQDQNESRLQREQDQNELRLQREQDKNDSRLQREQELNISQTAQAAQSKALIDQYRDEVFISYIKEMGDLLEKKNGSLTSEPLTAIVARVKTLNAIRQLDGQRQVHIIGFLYEAGQLANTNASIALDISTAKLTDIDFGGVMPSKKIENMSLAGVYLVNSTFSDMSLLSVNFSTAWLSNVNFSSVKQVENVNFSFARLVDVSFSSAESVGNVNFSNASLYNVNFSSVEWLENVNFSSAQLKDVSFASARLDTVSFSSARLHNVNFSSAHFISWFGPTRFDHAKMAGSTFEKCRFQETDFSYANLKNSSFHSADMFNNANFFLANLQNADLTNATVSDTQLQSALSIRNAKLPNGTLGKGRNAVKNGDADCNISLVDHWQVHNGSIVVVPSEKDQSQCQFSVQSVATEAMMSQRIALADIWNSSLHRNSYVELQAQMSIGVSIELISRTDDGKVVNKRIENSSENKISLVLLPIMEELEVVLKFDAQTNKSNTENCWCDDIELFVDYDA